MRLTWRLLVVCLIMFALPSAAQFFNTGRTTRPSQTTFGNGGQPWPTLTQINAENYDQGGSGVAYQAAINVGCLQTSSYRPDTVNFKVSTNGPAYQICSGLGDSYNYTINQQTNGGPYVATMQLADASVVAGGSWAILIDNVQVATVVTPLTGDYTKFVPVSSGQQFNISAGNHILTFKIATADSNGGAGDFSTFTIGPPSNFVACDIGPPYTGSIPAAAIQAFGTAPKCAANYDFTQIQSFTDSLGTHQWSNLSSWFTCNRTPPFLFSRADFSDVPCDTAHVNIVTDGGTQVLASSYYLTDKNNGQYSSSMDTSVNVSGSIVGTSFTVSMYIEQVIRVNSRNVCSSSCLAYSLATYHPLFNVNNPCFVSGDFDEISGYSGDTLSNSSLHLWNPTCGTSGGTFGDATPTRSPQASTSSYGTYGALMTADDVSQFSLCNNWATGAVSGLPASAFLSCSNTFQGVASVVPPSTAPVFSARQMVQLWEGPESSGQGGSVWTGTQHTTYIQRATVWVCPNPTGGTWQTTGQCYVNPVITTHP